MKNRWKTICSLMSVMTLTGAAVADTSNDGISTKPTKFHSNYDVGADLPGVLNLGRGDRQLPNLGGSCQLLYGANHNNATSFECMDEFHPISNGNITAVSWAGVYRKGTSTATFANAQPPGLEPGTTGTEQFEITVYEMDTAGGAFDVGLPLNAATDIFPSRVSRQLVTPTRTTDPNTVTVSPVTYTIYDYQATLTAIPVVNTKCYYLQIRAVCNANFDGSFNNGSSTVPGWSFRWMRGLGGNGRAIQAASLNNVPPTAACGSPTAVAQTIAATDAAAADFAFCLDIAFDRSAPCKQTGTCQQVAANCQEYQNGTENRFSFAAGAKSADNFVLTSTTNLQGVCWTGWYNGQVAVNTLTDTGFTINIYANNTAPCGALGTFSFPTTLVATKTVTPAATGNDGQTRVNAARNNGPPITYTNFYEYNTQFNTPITLNPGCYWIEIVSNSATAWTWASNFGDPNNTNHNGGDNYFHQHANAAAYGIGSRVSGFDLAWCLNFAINPINNACPPGPAPANSACLTAQALTIGGAPVAGFDTITGGGVDSGNNQLPPAFGTVIDNSGSGGVWYTVVGNGANITVSTCNSGTAPCAGTPTATDHDTLIAVYCAASCAGPFKSVAYNDDQGGTACAVLATASTVTFPSVSGQTYYVFVQRAGFSGFFFVNATTAALGTLTPSACATINEPPAPILTFPGGSVAETEACGVGSAATAPGEVCGTAYAALPSTRYCGTLDSSPSTFDDDWYKFPDVVANTNYDVELLCESPVNIFVYNAGPTTCPGGTGAPTAAAIAGFTIFPNNVVGNPQFQVATTAGQLYILVQPTQFDGMACSTNRNKYCLIITQPDVGSCCVTTGSGCVVTTFLDCVGSANNPNGTWVGGAVCNGVTDCDPNTGLPFAASGACCLFDGGCALTVAAGCSSPNNFVVAGTCTPTSPCTTAALAAASCCFPNQSCAIYNATFCTQAGGTFNLNKGCLPNICVPPVTTGRCCIGSRCAIVQPASCVAAGTAGVVFTAGAANCNAVNVFNTPCCFADYNKQGGIGVQDIFDFLAGWFANSVNANVAGDGIAAPGVQDIFDFLAAWFAGGC